MLIRPASVGLICRVLSQLTSCDAPVSVLPSFCATWPGLRVAFIERLNGAVYIAPVTSWCASGAWGEMLEIIKDYAYKPSLTAGGIERRLICLRNVCGLPLHVQHALRNIIERSSATSFFVLTVSSQSCIDVALRSRLVPIRPPMVRRYEDTEDTEEGTKGAKDTEEGTRGAEGMAAVCARFGGTLDDSITDRRNITISRIASTDHTFSILERRGAIVGAAGVAVTERIWRQVLDSA